MKKSELLTFISKYNLTNVEQVKFVSENGKLKTSFLTDDKYVIGNVVFKCFKNKDFTVGVYETSKLKSLLSVLDDDIELKIKEKNGIEYCFNFSDKSTEIDFILAELDVIPKVPTAKSLPDFDVILNLDKEFISKFVKAKNALPEANTFALVQEKKLNIYLGYSDNNTNRIKLEPKAEAGKDTVDKVIHFSAKYFKEIISVNSEITEFKLYISTKGLAKVEFEKDNFYSEYFLVEIPVEN